MIRALCFYICLLPVLLLLAGCALINGEGKPEPAERNRWDQEIQNYAVYYGENRPEHLTGYDLAILEPSHHSSREIRDLNRNMVTTAYLSVGETNRLLTNRGNGPGNYASWYMDRNGDGVPDQNSNWDSYYVDARDPAWRDYILQKAESLLGEQRFRALFLDTVSTADRFPETTAGMVDLIELLRESFPGTPIILNHSHQVYPEVVELLDGVMVEGVSCYYDFETDAYRGRSGEDRVRHREKTNEIRRQAENRRPHIQFFALEYVGDMEETRLSRCAGHVRDLGFLPFVSTIDLTTVVPPVEKVTQPGG